MTVPGLSWDYLASQHPCGRVSQNARVTLAVSGLSWDYLPLPLPSNPVAEDPGNTGSPGTILGLWQSIPVHQSYTGSPYPGTTFSPSTPVAEFPECRSNTGTLGIIPGLLPPHYPCGRVSRYTRVTLAVLGLSWEYLSSPATLR